MPGYLLNKAASVMCSHGATAMPTAVSTRVKIDGQPAVLQPGSWTVSGCPSQPPPNGPGMDTSGTFSSGSTRVKIEGKPVLLADSQSTAAATGTPLTISNAGQTKVKGV
ncbi:MAG: hypothetical protein KC420_07155 [Myxococcales bacterium]|nr:hypothetical protein [Myxococcales bacterium]MCB9566040.1 hypothetical protein [Myxococcales bacterium]MCB9702779.1 hypothetical protein [Myxococcales bacterium]